MVVVVAVVVIVSTSSSNSSSNSSSSSSSTGMAEIGIPARQRLANKLVGVKSLGYTSSRNQMYSRESAAISNK